MKGAVPENVMFSPDAVRSSKRFTRAAPSAVAFSAFHVNEGGIIPWTKASVLRNGPGVLQALLWTHAAKSTSNSVLLTTGVIPASLRAE
jgi:hypothetical protein